jgi:hypothetical protein
MIKIADKICEFRHDTGRWPYTEKEILENSEILDGMDFKTLYGKPISYDSGRLSLYSDCPHGTSPAHGFFFAARYEDTYQQGPNQQVDPIVTTPVDEVEAQGTQGHP